MSSVLVAERYNQSPQFSRVDSQLSLLYVWFSTLSVAREVSMI
ncbi:MAG: hypothetical protein ACPG52_02430 [Cognaticolwellia sp.]